MPTGYLIVETRPDRLGWVRIRGADHPPISPAAPRVESAEPWIRYAASFANLHVALMHAHAALRHRTIDAEAGLYRVDPVTAVAAVEAIDLGHRPVYLDPQIASDPRFASEVERRRRRHRQLDRFFTGVGLAAIGLLLLALLIR